MNDLCYAYIEKERETIMEETRIRIERSKKGFPCLWKQVGLTNTGEAVIIAGGGGQQRSPSTLEKRHLQSKHALIPIELGDFVIEADHHREDFIIKSSFTIL